MFSSFPNGAAGIGLLLLRATAGTALLVQGVRFSADGLATSWGGALDVLAIANGCALVTGTLTPAAGVVAAALSLAGQFAPFLGPGSSGLESGQALGLLSVMGVTVALLGPGAYSVDARLFGRREIVVPRPPRGRLDDP